MVGRYFTLGILPNEYSLKNGMQYSLVQNDLHVQCLFKIKNM